MGLLDGASVVKLKCIQHLLPAAMWPQYFESVRGAICALRDRLVAQAAYPCNTHGRHQAIWHFEYCFMNLWWRHLWDLNLHMYLTEMCNVQMAYPLLLKTDYRQNTFVVVQTKVSHWVSQLQYNKVADRKLWY